MEKRQRACKKRPESTGDHTQTIHSSNTLAVQTAAGNMCRLESLKAEATWKLQSGTGSSRTAPAGNQGAGGGRGGGAALSEV
jgi:hypothetical protein